MRRFICTLAVAALFVGLAACQRDVTRPEATFSAQTVAGAGLAAEPGITMTLIPGISRSATGINDLGQVVGTVGCSLSITGCPYVWTPGNSSVVLLEMPPGGIAVSVYDINDAGTAVGGVQQVAGYWAVRWSVAGTAEVVQSYGGNLYSVNEFGWAAGSSGTLSPDNVVGRLLVPWCTWCRGSGWDINNAGQVTGSVLDPTAGPPHGTRAALWEADGSFTDLGVPPGPSNQATAARGTSESGHVVGRMTDPAGMTHAFLWTPELGLKDLGTNPFSDGCPGLSAQDISDRDEVVGMSYGPSATSCYMVPFYWSEATGFVQLPAPAGYETGSGIARRINNRGQIVGDFTNGPGQAVAVLWELSGTCAADAAGVVAQLQAIVAQWRSSGSLNAGQANALDSKLSATARSLAGNRVEPARGQLGAFLNQLDAFVRTGKLTQDAVELAVTCARQALEQLARQ